MQHCNTALTCLLSAFLFPFSPTCFVKRFCRLRTFHFHFSLARGGGKQHRIYYAHIAVCLARPKTIWPTDTGRISGGDSSLEGRTRSHSNRLIHMPLRPRRWTVAMGSARQWDSEWEEQARDRGLVRMWLLQESHYSLHATRYSYSLIATWMLLKLCFQNIQIINISLNVTSFATRYWLLVTRYFMVMFFFVLEYKNIY